MDKTLGYIVLATCTLFFFFVSIAMGYKRYRK